MPPNALERMNTHGNKAFESNTYTDMETKNTIELTEEFPMHRQGDGHWITVLDVAPHEEAAFVLIQHRHGSAKIELPAKKLRMLAADLLKAADVLDGVPEATA